MHLVESLRSAPALPTSDGTTQDIKVWCICIGLFHFHVEWRPRKAIALVQSFRCAPTLSNSDVTTSGYERLKYLYCFIRFPCWMTTSGSKMSCWEFYIRTDFVGLVESFRSAPTLSNSDGTTSSYETLKYRYCLIQVPCWMTTLGSDGSCSEF